MKIASVLVARALAWIEPAELNANGTVFYPELVQALTARYKFQTFPKSAEDFDEGKGIIFGMGQFGNAVIDKLGIYAFGITLETSVSTDLSRQLLEEALEWAASDIGLTYRAGMIKRWQYGSQLVFYSDAQMSLLSPAVERLVKGVAAGVSDVTGEKLDYDISILAADHDQLQRKHPLGRFSIQRRDNTPYSEKKYFSDAPLSTKVHVDLLTEFEQELLGAKSSM